MLPLYVGRFVQLLIYFSEGRRQGVVKGIYWYHYRNV